jgi:hypothetical protein
LNTSEFATWNTMNLMRLVTITKNMQISSCEYYGSPNDAR